MTFLNWYNNADRTECKTVSFANDKPAALGTQEYFQQQQTNDDAVPTCRDMFSALSSVETESELVSSTFTFLVLIRSLSFWTAAKGKADVECDWWKHHATMQVYKTAQWMFTAERIFAWGERKGNANDV